MRKLSDKQLAINTHKWETDIKPARLQELKKYNPRIYNVIVDPDFNAPQLNKIPKSAYLYGGVGTGKTVDAVWRMIEWMRLRTLQSQPVRQLPIFTTCVELFQTIRNAYNPKSEATEEQILKLYQETEMLVVDDLGVMQTSEWAYKIMYQIIDYRYSHFLPTIYTSNLSLADLAGVLGDDRIPDRIQHDCKGHIYKFNSKSRRS